MATLKNAPEYEADMRQHLSTVLAEKKKKLDALESIALAVARHYGDVLDSEEIWKAVSTASKSKFTGKWKSPKSESVDASMVGFFGLKTLDELQTLLTRYLRSSVKAEEARTRKTRKFAAEIIDTYKPVQATFTVLQEKQLTRALTAHRAAFDAALSTK